MVNDFFAQLGELAERAKKVRKIIDPNQLQLRSIPVREEIRQFALDYFNNVKPGLVRSDIDSSDTDILMGNLFELANKAALVSAYKRLLTKIEKKLREMELASVSIGCQHSDEEMSILPIENRIVETLEAFLPLTALSYRQVLKDIRDPGQFSYRGTAAELREVLRETLNYLAPDSEIMKEKDFKLERDCVKPTMQQKARYILRSRGNTSGSVEVPEKAISIVEDTVSSLVRSTYGRSSIDTHTVSGISKANMLQLKMYVDSVLCELLEIHKAD